MTDERTAYSDSLDFSEQLSYRKHFHPSYGLFSMIFKRFKQYFEIIINSKLIDKMLWVPSPVYTECTQRLTCGPGDPVDQSKFEWSTKGGAPLSLIA